ncbi:hypothetical protein AS4_27620 [Acinetobacter guillouiae]|nr:hypothetical protein AS4_27620 [Acinetobacter guillouiae]
MNPIIARDDWFSVEANFYDLIMNYFKYKGEKILGKYFSNINRPRQLTSPAPSTFSINLASYD